MSEQKWTKGPWRVVILGTPMPAPDGLTPDQKAKWDRIQSEMNKPFRHNDGSFVVSSIADDDRKPVASVSFQGKAKRGQAYCTDDPEGLANAEIIAKIPQLYAALQREVSNCPTCGGEEALSELCPRCKESRELLESIR